MESHTWKCPECEFETEWSYETLATEGGPVCPNCDCDMELEKE